MDEWIDGWGDRVEGHRDGWVTYIYCPSLDFYVSTIYYLSTLSSLLSLTRDELREDAPHAPHIACVRPAQAQDHLGRPVVTGAHHGRVVLQQEKERGERGWGGRQEKGKELNK